VCSHGCGSGNGRQADDLLVLEEQHNYVNLTNIQTNPARLRKTIPTMLKLN